MLKKVFSRNSGSRPELSTPGVSAAFLWACRFFTDLNHQSCCSATWWTCVSLPSGSQLFSGRSHISDNPVLAAVTHSVRWSQLSIKLHHLRYFYTAFEFNWCSWKWKVVWRFESKYLYHFFFNLLKDILMIWILSDLMWGGDPKVENHHNFSCYFLISWCF